MMTGGKINMSYVMAAPEMITAAASTVAVIPAAADEVSASIARLFSGHAQGYQALAGQAAAFHEQFVQHLNASARSYAANEASNAASLQRLNASAGSSASAIAALPGPLLNLLTRGFHGKSLWGWVVHEEWCSDLG
jgi:hypothetical protein